LYYIKASVLLAGGSVNNNRGIEIYTQTLGIISRSDSLSQPTTLVKISTSTVVALQAGDVVRARARHGESGSISALISRPGHLIVYRVDSIVTATPTPAPTPTPGVTGSPTIAETIAGYKIVYLTQGDGNLYASYNNFKFAAVSMATTIDNEYLGAMAFPFFSDGVNNMLTKFINTGVNLYSNEGRSLGPVYTYFAEGSTIPALKISDLTIDTWSGFGIEGQPTNFNCNGWSSDSSSVYSTFVSSTGNGVATCNQIKAYYYIVPIPTTPFAAYKTFKLGHSPQMGGFYGNPDNIQTACRTAVSLTHTHGVRAFAMSGENVYNTLMEKFSRLDLPWLNTCSSNIGTPLTVVINSRSGDPIDSTCHRYTGGRWAGLEYSTTRTRGNSQICSTFVAWDSSSASSTTTKFDTGAGYFITDSFSSFCDSTGHHTCIVPLSTIEYSSFSYYKLFELSQQPGGFYGSWAGVQTACQSAFSGETFGYRAFPFLADANTNLEVHFTRGDLNIRNINNQVLGTVKNLFDGATMSFAVTAAGGAAWLGFDRYGTVDTTSYCNNWSDSTAGFTGDTLIQTATSLIPAETNAISCANSRRFICVVPMP
jgi:hypothetical protein